MASVVLNAYRVEEMHFKNVLETGTQIKLDGVEYTVVSQSEILAVVE